MCHLGKARKGPLSIHQGNAFSKSDHIRFATTIRSHESDEVLCTALLDRHVRVCETSLRNGGVEPAGITGYDVVEACAKDLSDVARPCTDVVGEGPAVAVISVIIPDAIVKWRGVDWSMGGVLYPIEVRAPIEKT